MVLWVWVGRGGRFFVFFAFHGAPLFHLTCERRRMSGERAGRERQTFAESLRRELHVAADLEEEGLDICGG